MAEYLENEQDTKFVLDLENFEFLSVSFKPAWKEIDTLTGENTGRFRGCILEKYINIEDLPESVKKSLKKIIVKAMQDRENK